MTTIRLHRHIFSGAAPEVFEAESIARWLVDHYGESPTVGVQVFAGEPSSETDISGNADAILRNDAPEYVVLESPGTPLNLLMIVISMALNAAVTFLFAKDPASLDNRTQESPNNQLSNRQNRVRALERVEDIYGTVKAIPSLLMPTYNKYIDHKKVEYGYYCVGRGYYDIADIRDGDTLLSAITGASAAVYEPFSSPNSAYPVLQIGDPIIDNILTVSRSSSVDGITLKAQNQINLSAGQSYIFYGPGPGNGLVPPTSLDLLLQPTNGRKPNFAAVAEAGQTVTIAMADAGAVRDGGESIAVDGGTNTYTSGVPGIFRGVVIGSTVTVSGGFSDPANTGAKTVVSHTDDTLTVAEPLVTELAGESEFAVVVNYSGTRTIVTVDSGYITLNGPPQFFPAVGETMTADLTVVNGITDWTDWYTLPDADRTEVWTNVLAQAGMYKDDGAKSSATVSYEVQIEKLNSLFSPLGIVETVTGSISGATSSERAETLERVTGWAGPARVRARRTTPFDYDFTGLVNDEIKWVDLYSVSPVTKAHFGNKTTIHTITKATAGSTSLRNRELNCLASRKLPTYDGVSSFSGAFDAEGRHVSGTISATTRIMDIIAAVTLDPAIGGRTIADLDMAQIYSVQLALYYWHIEVGQFNYTFDSDSLSFEETVNAIANAAFCVPYRQNGKIRLALDRPQANSVALFTHRNKKPNAETITRTFASDSDYDGVEMVYMDPDTQQQETIRIPLDGSYTKLKKVEITGIRSYEQAWFRANREYRRLIGQRLTIDTETTTDARALLPNSRVDIVDNTRFKSWDGEVVAQSGLMLTLSRDVQFTPATPHSIQLMRRDGSLQSIACTEVAGAPNKVLLAGAPAEAIVTQVTPEDGIRTIFSFAADSARGAQAWLVQEIGPTDGGYVRIKAVNYSDDYYAADSAPVPDKSGVIN